MEVIDASVLPESRLCPEICIEMKLDLCIVPLFYLFAACDYNLFAVFSVLKKAVDRVFVYSIGDFPVGKGVINLFSDMSSAPSEGG